MFQFLIGKIKSKLLYYENFIDSEFQFLIGKIKSHSDVTEKLPELKFQFLIGKIKSEIMAARAAQERCGFNSS